MQPGRPQWTDVAKIFANVLVACGTLWLILSGACTAFFAVGGLISGGLTDPEFFNAVFLVGLVSCSLGLILRLGGRFIRRRAERVEARRDQQVF